MFGAVARVPAGLADRSHFGKPVDAMRILLQHARTQLYLRSLGNWSANPLDAHDFQHSQRAIDFAREHGIGGVQIAVKFLDSQYDEVFPMPARVAASAKMVG
jgi:hypothetical protein